MKNYIVQYYAAGRWSDEAVCNSLPEAMRVMGEHLQEFTGLCCRIVEEPKVIITVDPKDL